MEEVNDNELPMEPLHYPAVAAGAEELRPMGTGRVDDEICVARGAVASEQDKEPQASEQSIGQMIQKPRLDSQS